MKKLSDMSCEEFVEAMAAVLFRVWGFVFVVTAFVYFLRWEFYFAAAWRRGVEMISTGILDRDLAILHLIVALLMLTRPVGLARLICRGLALQLTERENSPNP